MAETPEKNDAAAKKAAYHRAYWLKNRERIKARRRERDAENRAAGKKKKRYPVDPQKQSEQNRRAYAANREKFKARAQAWREANRDRCRATKRAYRKSHAEEQKAKFRSDKDAQRKRYAYLHQWQKAKAASNPGYAVYMRIMARMSVAMRKHREGKRVTSASIIVQLLGCEWLDFIAHIESQFQPGMTWENHGHSGWHFDHIVPLSSFDLTDAEQLKKGCHFTNVQPLWAADNIRKGGKVA